MAGSRETETTKSGQFEGESQSENEDDSDYPIVFQCKKCRTILGDSLSWLGSNEDLSIFALKRVTSKVVVDEKLIMSQKPPDLGSTYFNLSCAKCHLEVGRRYQSTAYGHGLDDLRGVYSLYVAVVENYTVGSGCQEADVGDLVDEFLSVSKIRSLQAKVNKMQTLTLMLNQRVTVLEQSMMEEEEEEEEAWSDDEAGSVSVESVNGISEEVESVVEDDKSRFADRTNTSARSKSSREDVDISASEKRNGLKHSKLSDSVRSEANDSKHARSKRKTPDTEPRSNSKKRKM